MDITITPKSSWILACCRYLRRKKFRVVTQLFFAEDEPAGVIPYATAA